MNLFLMLSLQKSNFPPKNVKKKKKKKRKKKNQKKRQKKTYKRLVTNLDK